MASHPALLCICGQQLSLKKADECYNGGGVSCDQCGTQAPHGNAFVFHCEREWDDSTHPRGFDMCPTCAQNHYQSQSTVAQQPLKPSQFIVIPRAVQEHSLTPAFACRSLCYWPGSLSFGQWFSPHLQVSSLTVYCNATGNLQAMLSFNNRAKPNHNQFASPSNLMHAQTTTDRDVTKFEESFSTKPSEWPSSSSSAVTNFPALIAQIKEDSFDHHQQLKQCMNEFQAKEANDIYIRRMTDKQNVNKKWSVQGLIDPEKHLSTLDHSLNLDVLLKANKKKHTNTVNYHHLIPSVFQVNEQGTECKLLSEIPNLNAYKYGNTLYKLMEKLFLFQLPQFENVTGYRLRNVPLQVVVKAQDYQLSDCNQEDSYLGNMHREGLYEDIAAVGLYYYHIDERIKGGALELSSVIKVEDSMDRTGATVLRETSVAVKEGSSVVFNNKLCYHRVSKLYGNGSRKIVAFFLITPNFQNPVIDARFVVVNWKYHAKHLLFKWLKQEGLMSGYAWILDILYEYVIGSRKYIEDATEFYNECRRACCSDITFDISEITSTGRRQLVVFD